ncbi:orotate phosphoribosyltransferase [bacterium]|nr:orotate phosphoribosyltransferase [bacterium]
MHQSNKPAAIRMFEHFGVITKGHFQLSSGKHSDTYLQCAKLDGSPYAMIAIASKLVDENLMWKHNVTHVVAPAMGAVIFGYTLAMVLSKPFIYLERVEGELTLRRGFQIPEKANVLCVEDVITTAKTIKEVESIVTANGAKIEDKVCIVNRSQDESIKSYIKLTVDAWEPSECPLCDEGSIPPSYPGSRKK